MIKKIPLDALRAGMYVHDLNCGWMDHPFARNRFKVDNPQELKQIRELAIKELYIDTSKGLDVPNAPTREQANAPQQRAVQELIRKEKRAGLKQPVKVSFNEEIGTALDITRDANRLIDQLMQDVRLGKQLELERTEHVIERMTRSLIRNPDALLGLSQIRDADHYTFEHSVGVCTLMVAFAHFLGLEPEEISRIGIGAMLHDIGKIKVPDAVLNKPGKLSDEEFKVMKSHVVHSKLLLAQAPGIDPIALAVAAEHHERYDGSGYPNRLRGDQISHYGQMAAIVDVYDAITSDRCYHKGMAPTEALRRLYEWSEFQFNPKLTQQFIRFVGVYPPGSIVELESRHIALVLAKSKDPLRPWVRRVYDTDRQAPIRPQDLDLSTGQDSILGYAVVERWGLDPQNLLKLML